MVLWRLSLKRQGVPGVGEPSCLASPFYMRIANLLKERSRANGTGLGNSYRLRFLDGTGRRAELATPRITHPLITFAPYRLAATTLLLISKFCVARVIPGKGRGLARKTWIKLKRGILEAKHRERIGPAVWLYIYILDRADWEQGAVLDWTDAGAAEELGMDINTLRNHRRKLEDERYISTQKKQYKQILYIHNWTNPREYDGKKYNVQSAKDS